MCSRCYGRWYHQTHRAENTARAYQWQANNVEKHRAARRAIALRKWYALSPSEKTEKSRAQEKRRTPEQMEARRAYWRSHYHGLSDEEKRKKKQAHNERRRKNPSYRARGVVNTQLRYARVRGLPATLTVEQWEAIKKAYGFRCAYCGGTPKRLTQDHVIAVTRGGGYTPDNIVPACQSCNARKGNKPPPTIPAIRLML